jgi:hypothetical protein
MYDDVRATWERLLSEGGARQRLIDHHLLHLYYGSDATSNAVFILVAASKPKVPQFSSVVSVDRGERGDGTWALVLTLQDRTYGDAFIGMCIELARRSNEALDADDSLAVFFHTLSQWKSLLSWNAQLLSAEALRGLIAEIFFGLNVLSKAESAHAALVAWRGPYGAPQDFILSNGDLFEVKAAHTGARTVEISSVDQLDPSNDAKLTLAVVPVDDSLPGTPGSHTLPSLVSEFRLSLGVGNPAQDELDHRLSSLGVDIEDDYYKEHFFVVSPPVYFAVDGDFPRLRRTNVPAAVDKVTYRLRLSGIEGFKIQTTDEGAPE